MVFLWVVYFVRLLLTNVNIFVVGAHLQNFKLLDLICLVIG